MRILSLTVSAAALIAAAAHAQSEDVQIRPGALFRSSAAPAPVASHLPPAPVNGSDSCATADALGSATGAIAYDCTAANTGTEGQTTFTGGYCNYGCAEYGTGQVAVLTDVWFTWTAPSTGRVRITSCPNQNDTKIAVYLGTSCTTGTSCVGCNDDYHFAGGVTAGLLDSIIYFDATAGQDYLIQVGQSSFNTGAPGFAGTFNIDVNPAHETGLVPFDDGLGDTNFRLGTALGDGAIAINRYANVGNTTTITGAQVCWGWAGSTGWVAGTPAYVGLWSDPNNDGDPNDAVLVESVATTIQSPGTDTYVPVNFTSAHTINGVYFLGYGSQAVAAADPIATGDNTTCNIQPNTAWRARNAGNPANLVTLSANSVPPGRLEAVTACQAQGAFNGLIHSAFTIRPVIQTGPPPVGTPECFGDGTGPTACPCANNGAAGRGCANSNVGSTGAVLTATGVASISADTVVLTCTDLTGPGLFFNASGVLGTPIQFGDGILCAAVGIVRMGVVFPTGNAASYPGGLTPNPIHIAGGIGAAGTFHNQCWYRDAIAFCTASTYNMSNGLGIVWTP